ncbi:MAG: hypothetical protein K6G84_05950 [Lachnospiraceae bacterium]|nr:hypothetical protein [Lachnospiraceae bacterium]
MKDENVRLIDAEHLKDRIQSKHTGDWYTIYNMLAMIDSEPTYDKTSHAAGAIKVNEKEEKKYIKMIYTVIVAIVVFAIFLYIHF